MKPNLLIAIAVLIYLTSCGREIPEVDCGENGEFLEGDCVCDVGWEGYVCDSWIIDRVVGNYTAGAIEVDSGRASIALGDIRVYTNGPNDKIFYLDAAQMRDPIACRIPGRRYNEAFVDWQNNVHSDTIGLSSPITIMGDMRLDYQEKFSLYLESHGCKLWYEKN